ncbi:MAG: hypothetical protein ACYSSO_04910, partial [Planctomycetota bacterium]
MASKSEKNVSSLIYAGIAALILVVQVPEEATAFMVSVNNAGSTTLHEITISPGDAFSVDLNVTTNEALIDIGGRFEASASNVFDITGGIYHSPWDALTNPIPVGGLDPASDYLRGSPGFGNSVGPGDWKFATLNLLLDQSTSLGTYTLNVTDVR